MYCCVDTNLPPEPLRMYIAKLELLALGESFSAGFLSRATSDN